MRELVGWQDHVVEYPGRFQEQDLGSGLIQLTPSPGKVKKQGTPQTVSYTHLHQDVFLDLKNP